MKVQYKDGFKADGKEVSKAYLLNLLTDIQYALNDSNKAKRHLNMLPIEVKTLNHLASSSEQSKQILNFIKFDSERNTLMATNGYELAMIIYSGSNVFDHDGIFDVSKDVSYTHHLKQNHLYQGKYPDCYKIIPKHCESFTISITKEMIKTLKQWDKDLKSSDPVVLRMSEADLFIDSQDLRFQFGHVHNTYQGKSDICFDLPKFLRAVLFVGVGDHTFKYGLVPEIQPVILEASKDGKDYFYMLMPVKP